MSVFCFEENPSMEHNDTNDDLSRGKIPATWDLTADVVIVGAGAAGLSAAVKAGDAGAAGIVVETKYDVGGHAIISGGNTPPGGGTRAQKKDGKKESPGLGL